MLVYIIILYILYILKASESFLRHNMFTVMYVDHYYYQEISLDINSCGFCQ